MPASFIISYKGARESGNLSSTFAAHTRSCVRSNSCVLERIGLSALPVTPYDRISDSPNPAIGKSKWSEWFASLLLAVVPQHSNRKAEKRQQSYIVQVDGSVRTVQFEQWRRDAGQVGVGARWQLRNLRYFVVFQVIQDGISRVSLHQIRIAFQFVAVEECAKYGPLVGRLQSARDVVGVAALTWWAGWIWADSTSTHGRSGTVACLPCIWPGRRSDRTISW